MSSVAVNTAVNVNIDFELAGVGKRILAWAVDLVIRIIYLCGCVSLFDTSTGTSTLRVALMLAIYLPVLFYFLLFELLMNGQTPGKILFKIKVVSLSGYKPGYIQYINRWVFRLMDTGFITILFFGILGDWVYGTYFFVANLISLIYIINSKKEQRIGDVVANTVVIRLSSTTRIQDTIFTEVEQSYKITYPNATQLSDRDISIIKNALNNAIRFKRYDTLWRITDKIQPVIKAPSIDDPYHFLTTLVRDYNYLTTR